MIGSQVPRISVVPKKIKSYQDGEDAVLLYRAYATSLDPWQELLTRNSLALDASGNYAVASFGTSVPRQNGKNVFIESREFYGMVVNGEKILHTAHQTSTTMKSFNRMVRLFEDPKHPEIQELVKDVRRGNGKEAIILKNGGEIGYNTRSKQAARGFDGISLLVYDEAQELTDDQQEASMPILSASTTGTRQIIYAGTPPYPKCLGTVFKRFRNSCLNNPSERAAWFEWSVEGNSINDIDISDKSLWYAANPELGIRLSEEFVEEEYKSMSPDGFARERLGWWAPEVTEDDELVIDVEKWKKCVSDEMKPEGKTAYGIKFSLDGSEVCLAGAVIPKDGKPRISLIARESTSNGIQWLADWINARNKVASCVVIDGRNGVDLLIDRIKKTWVYKGSIIKANSSDVIAAVSMIRAAVDEGGLTWFRKQETLNVSAQTATKRKIGQGFGFGGPEAGPIEACSLALWGAKTTKRDPSRKMRIG